MQYMSKLHDRNERRNSPLRGRSHTSMHIEREKKKKDSDFRKIYGLTLAFLFLFLYFSHYKVVRMVLVHRASARALAPSVEMLLPSRLSVEMYLSIVEKVAI